MEVFYCQCFCDFLDGKAYTSFVVFADSKLILIEKNKVFEAMNLHEAFIKIANRMILKLEEEHDKYVLNKKLIFIISNEELYMDLLSDNKRGGLGSSVNGLYQYLYDFIRREDIKLVLDTNEYLLNYTDSNSNISGYFKFYVLISKLCSYIHKSHYLNQEYNRRLSLCDMATQDILHFIEFEDLDIEKKIEFVDAIKKIRRERRILKHEIDSITYLSRDLNRLLNMLDSLLTKSNQSLSENELMKYKHIFSTKVGREKFLNNL